MASYADIEALPEHITGELIDGDLVVSRRLWPRILLTESHVITDFVRTFGPGRDPGGWWILYRTELHLSGDVLVPTLAGWRQQRMPDVIQTRKSDAYARHGVPWMWLVDPPARTLAVAKLGPGPRRETQVFAGDVAVRAAPFDAIELDLGSWWLPD